MSIRLRVAAVLALAAALTFAGATSRTWVTPAAAATSNGQVVRHASCATGGLYVTRTTMRVGDGAARYLTSIALTAQSHPVGLVVDRVIGYGTKGSMIRRARGIGGVVDRTVSWTLHSRTPELSVHVAGVDQVTGAIVRGTC